MVSCIFLLFGSYFKLFYLSWTAQEELCCALSSADSGKCQLCSSSVSNMFLERFKNSTVWNISIYSLLDENWGGVNTFLLHWSKKSCSVQVLWDWSQLLVLGEATRWGHLVRATEGPCCCQSCQQSWHMWQLCHCRTQQDWTFGCWPVSAAFTACLGSFPDSDHMARWWCSC